MDIHSDQSSTKAALTCLASTMQKQGAWFHKDISILSQENGLNVEVNGPCDPSEIVIKIPTEQLVPVSRLNMRLEDNSFVIDPDRDELTPLQIGLAESIIEIYNLTGRPAFHLRECVWTRYREKAPNLIGDLLKARTLNQEQKNELNFLLKNDSGQDVSSFVCDSFWQSRVLGSSKDQGGTITTTVMPVVDFLDHNLFGSPYVTQNAALQIKAKRPYVGASTLYACYGMYDSLDTFITYGFIDIDVPVVRAIPMTIVLGNDKWLNVNSKTTAHVKSPLNNYLKDLQAYSPVVNVAEEVITVSHLLIPTTYAPDALRRIVLSLVHTAYQGQGVSTNHIIEQTYRVECEIVENTISFYRETLNAFGAYEIDKDNLLADVIRLCNVQLSKLYKYVYNFNYFQRQ